MIHILDIPSSLLNMTCITKSMTPVELSSMWNAFSKCKFDSENTKRLENFSWRLWYRESFQPATKSALLSTLPVSNLVTSPPPPPPTPTPTEPVIALPSPKSWISPLPSSSINMRANKTDLSSSMSSHSTAGPQTPSPVEAFRCQSPKRQGYSKQRANKFYVDDSEDENEYDNDHSQEEKDEDLWSTIHTNKEKYLNQAYQRNFGQPSFPSSPLSAPRVKAEKETASLLEFRPSSATNQKKPCSLLSRLLLQSSPETMHASTSTVTCDTLPPQLQSCVDWEKSQNAIPYRLGYSYDVPDENIVW